MRPRTTASVMTITGDCVDICQQLNELLRLNLCKIIFSTIEIVGFIF